MLTTKSIGGLWLDRRNLIIGAAALIAAPAIVRYEWMMPVKKVIRTYELSGGNHRNSASHWSYRWEVHSGYLPPEHDNPEIVLMQGDVWYCTNAHFGNQVQIYDGRKWNAAENQYVVPGSVRGYDVL